MPTKGADGTLPDGVRIVDCDAHWTEPADLWTSRAPAALRDRVPVQRTVDGYTAWYLGGEVWASTGGNTMVANRKKLLGTHAVQPFSDIDPSAWSVDKRLELLDDIGIDTQILYPNGIGFASNHIFAIEDVGDRAAILQMYNDHLVEVQHTSGGRLLPQALLPIWDMDLTVAEMTRLLDAGIRGFTLSDKPELLGLAELPEPYFEPMWDLFDQSGAVASFHIGAGQRREDMEAIRASTGVRTTSDDGEAPAQGIPAVAAPMWRSLHGQRGLVALATQFYMSNVRVVVNLCLSDLFDRFPRLKVVSAESGIGWVPFILEALEYQFNEMVTVPEALNAAKRRPKEYFKDHISVMFWFEEIGAEKLIEDVGVGNVLVETDVPHPTCLYPNPRDHFARVLGHLDEASQRMVLQDNAARLYNIDFSVA